MLCKFPVRVNSGHPLFIGYGRTGEIPVGGTNENLKRTQFSVSFSFFSLQNLRFIYSIQSQTAVYAVESLLTMRASVLCSRIKTSTRPAVTCQSLEKL